MLYVSYRDPCACVLTGYGVGCACVLTGNGGATRRTRTCAHVAGAVHARRRTTRNRGQGPCMTCEQA
eukprot:6621809-Prymnesium_polylepis.2